MGKKDTGNADGQRPARRRRHRIKIAAAAGLTILVTACSSGGTSASGGGTPAAGGGTPGSSAKTVELEFTACMRSHGVPGFPEPNAQGGVTLNGNIDVNSPTYSSAFNYCSQKYGFSGQASPGQSAAMLADNLRYAACMRGHGLKDFPDPNSHGQFQIQAAPTSDLNPGNPRYQAANNACSHLQFKGGGSGPQLGSNGGGAP